MPVSYHDSYETFKKWVEAYQPQSLWDIGMGYGNIGAMAKVIVPDIKLFGVEIWAPYLVDKLSHARLYETIMIGDVGNLCDRMWKTDVIVAFDVIEHLERGDGAQVIHRLTDLANMAVLVTVPIIDYPQGPAYGNPYEEHKTQWKVDEMEAIGGKTLFKGPVTGLFEFKKGVLDE